MALLLADSRFPGGGHAHSGGLEEAASRGLVRTEADLPAFLRNRLRTAGALAAVFAAAAARPGVDWLVLDAELDARTPSAAQRAASRAQGKATARAAKAMLAAAPTHSGEIVRDSHSLDLAGETDREARLGGSEREPRLVGQPGEGERVSHSLAQLGGAERVDRSLVRSGGAGDGHPGEAERGFRSLAQLGGAAGGGRLSGGERESHSLAQLCGGERGDRSLVRSGGAAGSGQPGEAERESHSFGQGAPGFNVTRGDRQFWVARVAGLLAVVPRPHHCVLLGALAGVPADAALAAAYLAVSGPASASVRLLGLDPLRVNAIVAALGADIAAVAAAAAASAECDPADLPAPGSPGLDVLAEEHDRHHREEVRLFAS